jgi:molybdenum transport protein
MIYFTDKEIDDLLTEDLPYSDLTTAILKLENKPSKIQFYTREDMVICCTEEAMKLFQKVGIQITLFTPSGEHIEKGIKFFEGEGLAKNVQAVLTTVENLIGYASGIATRTRKLVERAREINPDIHIATTRQTIPNTRKIAFKAVTAGGAAIHRLGLSGSLLVFESHYSFMGGIAGLEKRIKEQRGLICGKPIMVEVKNSNNARIIANAGVDTILLNGMSIKEIKGLKKELLTFNPEVKLAITGNIDLETVVDFAKSGADILLSSWPYYAPPSEMLVTVSPIFDMY